MIRPALLMIGLAGMLATGCDRRRDDVPVAVSVIGGAALLVDPASSPLDMPARILIGATAQGLVAFDATGQVEPGLAERWTVIDEGRSYIFRLRPATWPDGRAVTAAQVVASLRRAIAPRSRNTLKPYLTAISEVVEMTPQVIEIRLSKPRPDLLKLLAQPELAILLPRARGGSGPFRIESTTPDGVLLRPIAASDDADTPASPVPEEMVRVKGESAARAILRFSKRQSDLVLGGSFIDAPLLTLIETAPANQQFETPAGLFGFAITSREGFLAEVDNRAAVAMAIDQAAVTTAIRADWTGVATLLPERLDSATVPSLPAWSVIARDTRLVTARRQVTLWSEGAKASPVLRIALPGGPGANLVWTRVAVALRSIGVSAQRVAIDAPADLRLVDAVAPYDGARWYLATACAPCGKEAQEKLDAARDAPDIAARASALAAADVALAADVSFITIARPLRWSLVALRLGAWRGNARGWHPLNHLRNDTR